MDMNENDRLPIEPERCYLCHKVLLSDVVSSNDVVPMSICSDCKFLFLEDSGTLTQHTRYDSSPESIENILSQQFPDMINLGRHTQPMFTDHLTQSVDRLHTTHGRSRQWRRVLSDTESDGFDSVFGEVDDIFPYTAYVEDSEASVNVDDDDDDVDSDTDTLLSQDDDENMHGGMVGGARLHRSLATNGRNRSPDWLREVLSTEAGTGIGERNGIDEEVTWRNGGEYPAAVSFVESLERLIVGDDDMEGLVCVICKESVCVGSVVNRLPCLHVYHPSCIIPWLNAHNTCPLCRYEVPTDGQRMRPNRTHGLVVRNEGGGGGGGWWWWCMVAPLVSAVSIGLMLWFGGSGSQMDNRSRRWWSFL